MDKYSLSIFWSDEDESFIALSPEFPGMSAFGDDREEALKEAMYAMQEMEDMAKEYGDAIPEARKLPNHSGQFRVRIPRSLHTVLVLEAERQGISLNALIQMYLTQGITQENDNKKIEYILNKFIHVQNNLQQNRVTVDYQYRETLKIIKNKIESHNDTHFSLKLEIPKVMRSIS